MFLSSVRNTEPVAIVQLNGTATALVKKRFEIRCVAVGYPTPQITWSRENGTIVNDGVKYSLTNDSLVLLSPELADADLYTCTANNSRERTSSTVRLYVLGKQNGKQILWYRKFWTYNALSFLPRLQHHQCTLEAVVCLYFRARKLFFREVKKERNTDGTAEI